MYVTRDTCHVSRDKAKSPDCAELPWRDRERSEQNSTERAVQGYGTLTERIVNKPPSVAAANFP